MAIILGFDVSSSTVGWCALDTAPSPPNIIGYGYIKPLPVTKATVFQSLQQLRKDICLIIDQYKPDSIAIEDIVQFMQGHSGAKTIIKLAVYNRMVGLACADRIGSEPYLINVNSIRSKIRVGKDRPKKEDIPSVIEHHLKIQFPWQLKINKRTKLAETMVESYDIADGMAVALAFHLGARPIKKVKKAKKK